MRNLRTMSSTSKMDYLGKPAFQTLTLPNLIAAGGATTLTVGLAVCPTTGPLHRYGWQASDLQDPLVCRKNKTTCIIKQEEA